MKPFSVRFGVILIGHAIFAHAEVEGADWRIYARQCHNKPRLNITVE
jgi:hypothetical protein